jgi:hypothetical protein
VQSRCFMAERSPFRMFWKGRRYLNRGRGISQRYRHEAGGRVNAIPSRAALSYVPPS